MHRSPLTTAAAAIMLTLATTACNLALAISPQASPTPGSTPFAPPHTGTPLPPITPTAAADWPCIIEATRTPPAGAPTLAPGPGGTPETGFVDPHIELCASTTRAQVGQEVLLLGQVIQIGMPLYKVRLTDQEPLDGQGQIAASYDGEVTNLEDGSRVLEVVSVEAGPLQIRVAFRARQPGSVKIRIGATGEVHYGYPGPATWAGGGSDPLIITVIP